MVPGLTVLIKLSDEFAVFGVNTDHRQFLGIILSTLSVDIEELPVSALAVGWFARGCFDAFSILSQGVALGFEQSAYGGGAYIDTDLFELTGNSVSAFVAPLVAFNWITTGVVLHDLFEVCKDFERFFSADGRPPPPQRAP